MATDGVSFKIRNLTQDGTARRAGACGQDLENETVFRQPRLLFSQTLRMDCAPVIRFSWRYSCEILIFPDGRESSDLNRPYSERERISQNLNSTLMSARECSDRSIDFFVGSSWMEIAAKRPQIS